MIILLKIFIAHLIGDFLLQPEPWVRAKEEKKMQAWQLYVHVLIHGLLILLIIGDWHFWKWALLIALVHLVIDSAKILLQNKHNQRSLFLIDQLFHCVSIYGIWLWYKGQYISFSLFGNEKFLLLIALLIFLTNPVSIAVKIFISKWTPQTEDSVTGSLQSAGKYIGIFERLLVFVFIISNEWEAIGFLLAAKSVFRFGDLRESKDRKLTEYILIGTLLSFGIAILSGMTYHYLKEMKLF